MKESQSLPPLLLPRKDVLFNPPRVIWNFYLYESPLWQTLYCI